MKKIYYLIILAVILYTTNLRAQNTITDFSNVYLEKLIATAKENYPRMASFQERVNLAKNNISKEKISWLDAFSFTYIYKPDNTLDIVNPTFFNGYQAAVSFNLGSFLQKPYIIKQSKEELKLAQYEFEEYKLTIEAEVKRRYFSYLQHFNNMKLQTKLVSDMQNVNQDIRSKYERGELTFEQYNQAQKSLSEVMQQKIAIEANFLSAKASLEELLLKKLEEIR